MEKSQYKLCIEVLKRLKHSKVLDQLILIGSWSTLFYKDYFAGTEYMPTIKTRDMDFLIPFPSQITQKVDIADLVKDLGFIVSRTGTQGIIKLEHPELTIEFLVPEKGRGSDKPFALPLLGVNAQRLRFLNFVFDNTINVKIENLELRVPHPINFALHKLIIHQRRKSKDKALKDKESALRILNAAISQNESQLIREKFNNFPKGWQKKILEGLHESDDHVVIKVLKP